MTGGAAPSLGSRLRRYFSVGVFTSLLDLGIFSALSVGFGVPILLSHVVSTTVTMCTSYAINRRFVFRSGAGGRHVFAGFVATTLISAFVIQSGVLLAGQWVLAAVLGPHYPAWLNAALKVAAMVVGAVANFLGYNAVFTSKRA